MHKLCYPVVETSCAKKFACYFLIFDEYEYVFDYLSINYYSIILAARQRRVHFFDAPFKSRDSCRSVSASELNIHFCADIFSSSFATRCFFNPLSGETGDFVGDFFSLAI